MKMPQTWGVLQKGSGAWLLGSATPGFKSQLPSWLTSGTAVSGQVLPSQPQGRRNGAHPRGCGGPGAPGHRTKSQVTPAPGGLSSAQQAWAPRGHAGPPGPPFQPCQALPRTEAWSPAHLASLAREPDGKTAGGPTWWVPASTGKDSRTSSSREPQWVPTAPLNQDKQRKLKSEDFQKDPAHSHDLHHCGWVGTAGGATEGANVWLGALLGGPRYPWQHYTGWLQRGKLRPRALRPPPHGRAASWSRSRAPTDAHEPPGCECPRSSPVGARAGNARRDQVGSKPPPGGGPRPHGTGGSLTPAPPAPGGSRWSLRGLRTQPAHLHSCSPQGLR